MRTERSKKRRRKKLVRLCVVLVLLVLIAFAAYKIVLYEMNKDNISVSVIMPSSYTLETNNEKAKVELIDEKYMLDIEKGFEGSDLPVFKQYLVSDIKAVSEFVVKNKDQEVALINLSDNLYFAENFKYEIEKGAIREEAAKYVDQMYGKVVELKLSDPLYLSDRYVLVTASFNGDCRVLMMLHLDDNGYFSLSALNATNPHVLLEEHSQRAYINPTQMIDGKYPYCIKVNRVCNTVTIYTLDENGEYTDPVKAMICSTAREGEETPAGTFPMDKYKNRWNLMVDGSWGQYAYQFCLGGYLFHTICYYSPNNDAMMTYEYNLLGNRASLGCVRLQTIDARWIYDNIMVKTPVIVYDDPDNPGPLGKPEKAVKEITEALDCGWDPTDPLPSNPWRYKDY